MEKLKPSNSTLRFIPILDLFKNRILSRPTFYNHVKKGTFSLYKLGKRSFVDKKEFENAFIKQVQKNK